MSSMSDRKAELERKKAKLQALREEKDRRRREKEQKDAEEALQRASAASSLDRGRDLDEMLSSLGVAPVKDVLSSLSSMTSLTPPQTASPDASLPHSDKNSLPAQGGQKKSLQLQVVSVQSTDIPPKENVTYAKQTQTATTGGTELRDGYMEDWWRPRKAHATDYYVLTFDGDGARQGDEEEAAFHGKLPPGILPHGLPTVKEVQPAVTAAPQDKKEEEKEKKIRGRALVARPLRHQPGVVRGAPRAAAGRLPQQRRGAARPGRRVLGVERQVQEDHARGVFHCQSPVMSATFAKFHPNLILGGTYSGQIVLWDNRVQKRTPSAEDTSLIPCTHAPGVLPGRGGQPERAQPGVRVDGRAAVHVVAGHAGRAAGGAGAGAPPEQARRAHLPGLPRRRHQPLPGGRRGRQRLHRLPLRAEGGHHGVRGGARGPRDGAVVPLRARLRRPVAPLPHRVHGLEHAAVEPQGEQPAVLVRGQRGLRVGRALVASAPGAVGGGGRGGPAGRVGAEPRARGAGRVGRGAAGPRLQPRGVAPRRRAAGRRRRRGHRARARAVRQPRAAQ
ncbi:hypothetical protein ACJJTC_014733, partial [Scirpophaga incertulas]